jgi:DNA-directed RNA polymerase subunit alpha
MNSVSANWRGLIRPRAIAVDASTLTPFYGRFIAEPLERGYGITLGNALRRTALSSFAGAAATWARVEGSGTPEDPTELLLSLQEIVFRATEANSYVLELERTGPAIVRAGDFETGPGLAILNPDCELLTLEAGARLALEVGVEVGRGFVPAERIQTAPGKIPLNAAFSPIRKAAYEVSSARVGQRVDYDRLSFELWTNGSVEPRAAICFAARVLREQLSVFVNFDETLEQPDPPAVVAAPVNENLFRSVEELLLSVRAANCLQSAGIAWIGDLVQKNPRDLLGTRNFGRKSLLEIESTLEELGLSLGMKLDNWPHMLRSWQSRDP